MQQVRNAFWVLETDAADEVQLKMAADSVQNQILNVLVMIVSSRESQIMHIKPLNLKNDEPEDWRSVRVEDAVIYGNRSKSIKSMMFQALLTNSQCSQTE